MSNRPFTSVVAAAAAAGTVLAVSGPAQPVTAPAAPASAVAKHRVAPGLALIRKQAVVMRKNGKFGPFGPDPTRALVPSDKLVDWGGWRRAAHRLAEQRLAKAQANGVRRAPGAATARSALAAPAPRYVREDEPAGTRGSNDTFKSAQAVPGFGTAEGRYPAVTVLGRLSPAAVPPTEAVAPAPEPNDTTDTAYDLGVSTKRAGARTTGTVGDNIPDPQAPGATDLDTYKVTLKANQLLDVGVRRTSGDLLPFTALLDGDGNLVAFGDDDLESSSTLKFTSRAAGTYYVVTGGYSLIDVDENGNLTFTDTKGGYDLSATARAGDRDLYKVTLRGGDVLGANVTDAAAYVSVFDSKGVEVHGSPQDASSAYPENSPLPGGGNAVTDHVVARSGTYYVEVTQGDGPYEAQLEVYRYGGAAKKQTQTIFLDTDGQRLNTNVVGGRGVTTLSPLRSFLGAWGIPRSQEKALINRIKATVQENLSSDLRRSGLSKYVDVKVVTSLDGKDPFGRAGVTRLVVGGTIEQSGVSTIGIAQSIDPGNFDREETALVLLDVLSGSPKEWGDASLNYFLKKKSNRLAFVGHAVGNVISHEAGHMIGNWHTDNSDSKANLMDAGGENFGLLFGVGKDGVGGTKDDPDVDFGKDRFDLFEGFTGTEDTLARSTWGMSTRK